MAKKKLTEEQAEARIEMYNEAAEHMLMDVFDTNTEKEQAKVVSAQIRALCARFEAKFYKSNPSSQNHQK